MLLRFAGCAAEDDDDDDDDGEAPAEAPAGEANLFPPSVLEASDRRWTNFDVLHRPVQYRYNSM